MWYFFLSSNYKFEETPKNLRKVSLEDNIHSIITQKITKEDHQTTQKHIS